MTLPTVFWLDPGQSFTHAFGGSSRRTVTLRSVDVRWEPLVVNGASYRVFHEARVVIAMEGGEHELVCKAYELPREVDGLQIAVDLIREISDGTVPVKAGGAVRFSALDSTIPWTGDQPLAFPVSDYRWRAHVTRTHTWNGFVQVAPSDQGIYYHRGEDFGAIPNRHPVRAMMAGTVEAIPPEAGDGASNAIIVRNGGLVQRYAHANTTTIVREPALPRMVRAGDVLARTGNTWDGHPTPDPHLHVGLSEAQSGARVNPYPYVVEAYRATWPDEPLPVAGGFRFACAGNTVTLDASRSLPAGRGGALRYSWLASDGTRTEGPVLTRTYRETGTWSEVLVCTDGSGREAYDVAIVRVSPREDAGTGDEPYAGPPFGYLNTWPVRGVNPDEWVHVSFHGLGTGRAQIDFGDGSRPAALEYGASELPGGAEPELPATAWAKHGYRSPGWYVVTVRCEDAGAGPAELKTVVRVEE